MKRMSRISFIALCVCCAMCTDYTQRHGTSIVRAALLHVCEREN